MLLGDLGTSLGDCGSLASRGDLAETAHVSSLRLGPTLQVALDAAPVRPLDPSTAAGGVHVIFDGSRQWAWMYLRRKATEATHPVELVGHDASGTVVTTLKLRRP